MAEHPTGIPILLEPLVTRVLAPNASPFTYTGTQSHVVGDRDVAVIDPGPDDPAHIEALTRAIAGRTVVAILITHHHRDHSPASRPLARLTGAPVVGAAPFAPDYDGGRSDAAFDRDYAPDRILAEGEAVGGDGWTLGAIATPGHTSNHLAFELPETKALFSGDHVMGWSTSIVSPPDGDMAAYMASLEKLMERDDRVYYPGHGEAVDNPQRLVRGMLGHRKQREGQILRLLASEAQSIAAMTTRMYVGLNPKLIPAAERSVLAHLYDLRNRGLVREEGESWTTAA
ncbi:MULTISPECIES: MBL fold metallo-hydrolase [Sphingomonas]|jgi:glyoxylase-like metal-dependent hydrolase (beta-lactamase superfamily II)|uniref:MBL fold metallo-hydrolase n=1 Tax=Sphingomonas zeae TaxID=1646122 RepID=A0A7Y6B1Y4_9SPHN|nr:MULTISPECIES: MBL fold metallo-hydrolase [Sphingomonas]MBB4049538.1 glyoxylase-like metal-dependent hydrolase (beta-lactamase superfamily II) [Sphingomonas zeae]MDK8187691.1 MBL fold metallo-hydrolase [Sphingomonas zeae]MDK8217486.1 MBL fold metallo-hydrolase [Sphingomonas sp. UMB7805-LC452B]NUU45925.1 MBL fold metallo-hydrolase [Sphingomonas zeae]